MRTVTSTSTTNQISSSSALTVILHQKAEYDSALERAKPMDEDLANIIRRALDEAKAAGRDHTAQTIYAVKKVLELRHDMTASDALNAINLVRSFL